VLGALWNGQDAPPQSSSQAVVGGKVNKRVIRTRAGHEIALDDTNEKGTITIVDSTGQNKITISSVDNSVTIEGQNSLTLQGGQVAINGRTIKIEASGTVEIKGAQIKLN
jgi:hypothetical protein